MIKVSVKRFKKKLERSGKLREYRSRQFYDKPSEERRVELARAQHKEKIQQNLK
jgi:small subunit ribosomal protein S21